jgi:hypothetical protein
MKIAGLFVRHHFGTLVLQDRNDRLRIRSTLAGLLVLRRLKGCSNPIEFCVYLCLDLRCPSNLINGARLSALSDDPRSSSHGAIGCSIVTRA